MKKVRTKYKLMSVNQISLYHTILEVYNVINKSSSDQLKEKFMPEEPRASPPIYRKLRLSDREHV